MNLLLDSYAFLELLTPSVKADRVKQLVASADRVYTTVLNLYEVKYRVTQRASAATAEAYVASIKNSTRVLDVDETTALSASVLKLENPKLGAVDCVTLAAARVNELFLITGDSDFPKDEKIILL